MHMQFRVINEDGVIFDRDFVEPNPARLGAFTGIAVSEFVAKYPKISLLDEEVVMLWQNVKKTGE